MPTRQCVRLRARPGRSRVLRALAGPWAGYLLAGLAAAALALLSYWALQLRYREFFVVVQEVLPSAYSTAWKGLVKEWRAVPAVPPFLSGDERRVREFLDSQPLAVALVDLESPERTVWLAQDGRLFRSDTPRARHYGDLARTLANPALLPSIQDADPDRDQAIIGIVRAGGFALIKRLEPGSRALDRVLERLLGTDPEVRFGFQFTRIAYSSNKGRSTRYQFHFDELSRHYPSIKFQYTELSRDWQVGVVPGPRLYRRIRLLLGLRMAMVCLPLLLLGGALALYAWAKRKSRQREQLAMDRLASLTHGLKTPLAVLKARCDSIRFGRLSRNEADGELIRIGEEVDHLTLVLENSLRTVRVPPATGEVQPVTEAWLSDLAQDFEPLAELSSRPFEVDLREAGGHAPLASLREILQVLLDNAFLHGGGTVRFTAARSGARILLEVGDAGPGLEPHQLAAVGKPFLRFRAEEAEGFASRGMGLGLSLALQIAEKEGLGITLSSEPGQGLLATVVLHAT